MTDVVHVQRNADNYILTMSSFHFEDYKKLLEQREKIREKARIASRRRYVKKTNREKATVVLEIKDVETS